jgi:hypothetical protein
VLRAVETDCSAGQGSPRAVAPNEEEEEEEVPYDICYIIIKCEQEVLPQNCFIIRACYILTLNTGDQPYCSVTPLLVN